MNLRFLTIIVLMSFFSFCFGQKLEVGDKAPEIIQTTVDGAEFKLSDLKGKVVLIDFWASWCGPCRKEHPFLIEAYANYKDTEFKVGKGFEIVSVSLDSKKEAWEKAIEMDGVTWPNQVSDLRGRLNAASMKYKVKSIPANYLIDENGTILAINLRGKELSTKLRKLKKGFFSF